MPRGISVGAGLPGKLTGPIAVGDRVRGEHDCGSPAPGHRRSALHHGGGSWRALAASPGPSHIMKLRYIPLQQEVLTAEERTAGELTLPEGAGGYSRSGWLSCTVRWPLWLPASVPRLPQPGIAYASAGSPRSHGAQSSIRASAKAGPDSHHAHLQARRSAGDLEARSSVPSALVAVPRRQAGYILRPGAGKRGHGHGSSGSPASLSTDWLNVSSHSVACPLPRSAQRC